MKPNSEQLSKKNYRRPELITYGDIHKITQAVANNSMVLDGGSGKTQKTH
jgi:hypothetical protein